jgi:hypothetical protein
MKFRAARDYCFDGVRILLEESSDFGRRRVVEPMQLSLKEVQQGDPLEPTMTLDANAAQSLIDALWDAGLRPTEARYPNDHVNALRDHLADMRKLVFKE